MVTIVLLKEACMCAMPCTTCFFSFLLFFAAAFGFSAVPGVLGVVSCSSRSS